MALRSFDLDHELSPAIDAVRPAREPMRYYSEKTVRVTIDVNVNKMTLAGVLLAVIVWQILPAIVDAVVMAVR